MQYTVTGDMTGGGSSTINTTITGLMGHQLPALIPGVLKWNGTAWEFAAGVSSEKYLAVVNTDAYTTAYVANFSKTNAINAVLTDTQSCFNTTTKYYTCKSAGLYKVTLGLHYGDVSTRSMFSIFKNDVNLTEIYDDHNPQWMDTSTTWYFTLALDDTLMIARSTTLGASPYASQISIEKVI